jgi:hypothetical protein
LRPNIVVINSLFSLFVSRLSLSLFFTRRRRRGLKMRWRLWGNFSLFFRKRRRVDDDEKEEEEEEEEEEGEKNGALL